MWQWFNGEVSESTTRVTSTQYAYRGKRLPLFFTKIWNIHHEVPLFVLLSTKSCPGLPLISFFSSHRHFSLSLSLYLLPLKVVFVISPSILVVLRDEASVSEKRRRDFFKKILTMNCETDKFADVRAESIGCWTKVQSIHFTVCIMNNEASVWMQSVMRSVKDWTQIPWISWIHPWKERKRMS